jgi:hypothetical protein
LKVQHKQIRPSDQQPYDRGNGPDGYVDSHTYNINNNNHSSGANYGAARSMSLPPSGPMAASVGWYNNNSRLGPNGPSNSGVMSQDPAAAGIEGEGRQPYDGEDRATATANVAGKSSQNVYGPPQNNNDAVQEGGTASVADIVPGSDPLSTLETLRHTLPAVPDVGNVGSAATSAAEGEI